MKNYPFNSYNEETASRQILCKDCSCKTGSIERSMTVDETINKDAELFRFKKYYDQNYNFNNYQEPFRPVSMINLFKKKLNYVITRKPKYNFDTNMNDSKYFHMNKNDNSNQYRKFIRRMHDVNQQFDGKDNKYYTMPSFKSNRNSCNAQYATNITEKLNESKDANIESCSVDNFSDNSSKNKDNAMVLNAIRDLCHLLTDKFKDGTSTCPCAMKEKSDNVERMSKDMNNNLFLSPITANSLKCEIQELKNELETLKQQNENLKLKNPIVTCIKTIDRSVSTDSINIKLNNTKNIECYSTESPNSYSSAFNDKFQKMTFSPIEKVRKKKRCKEYKKPMLVNNSIQAKAPIVKPRYISMKTVSSADSITSILSNTISSIAHNKMDFNEDDNEKLHRFLKGETINNQENIEPKQTFQVDIDSYIDDTGLIDNNNHVRFDDKMDFRAQKKHFIESFMKENFPVSYVNSKDENSNTCNNPTEIEIKPKPKLFSLKNTKQRLPIHPSDVDVGDLVRFARNGSKICMGIVRYIGELPFQKETFLGIELETDDGLHDGIYYGKRYFKCNGNKGIFVSFHRVLMVFKK